MNPLPENARVQVTPAVADTLLRAARTLPVHANEAYYDVTRQNEVLIGIRAVCVRPFDDLVHHLTEKLERPPFAVVVRGLRFDDENRLLIALNRAFGILVARPFCKPRAQLLHYIEPRTDIVGKTHAYSEDLHTDGADWERPPQWMSLLCVRPDRLGGGRSRLVDMHALVAELRQRLDERLVQALQQPLPWRLASHLGGGVVWRPVLSDEHICWRRYTINFALTGPDAVTLEPKSLRALDAMTAVVDDCRSVMDFFLDSGDWLLADNRRTLHARTPITPQRPCRRLLIRSWIRRTPEPTASGSNTV